MDPIKLPPNDIIRTKQQIEFLFKSMGLDDVPVIELPFMSEEEIKEFIKEQALNENKSNRNSEA